MNRLLPGVATRDLDLVGVHGLGNGIVMLIYRRRLEHFRRSWDRGSHVVHRIEAVQGRARLGSALMAGLARASEKFTRGQLMLTIGVVGVVVGIVATWTIAAFRAEEPNPITNLEDADEALVREAADAWRAESAVDRPRGEITVVHTGRAGGRDVVVLHDETGLGGAYTRGADADSGEMRWVTTIGAAADPDHREPARLVAKSMRVGAADVWVDTRSPGTSLVAAVLTGGEVRWRPVEQEDGIAVDVPEVGPDSCGLRILAERRGDDRGAIHIVRSERTPIGAELRSDVRPLDDSGKRPSREPALARKSDLDAPELRLLSRLACIDGADVREPLTAFRSIAELWRGELPGSGEASLFEIRTGHDDDLLLLSKDGTDDTDEPTGSVLRRDLPPTGWREAAAAAWFDSTDPAADAEYRHWIVVAGTQEVARIEVLLATGQRITEQGRFLAVDLEELGIDGTMDYRATAFDRKGDPVLLLLP